MLTPVDALRLLLQHVDYQHGQAARNSQISWALPGEVLVQCREALEHLGPLPVPAEGLPPPQQLRRIAALLDDGNPTAAEIVRIAMRLLQEDIGGTQ